MTALINNSVMSVVSVGKDISLYKNDPFPLNAGNFSVEQMNHHCLVVPFPLLGCVVM